MVVFPQREKPFEAALFGPEPTFSVLLPWKPKSQGGSFETVSAGGVSMPVPATTISLYGRSLSGTIAYDDDTTLAIRAWDTSGFFGHVFVCADPGSDDLLVVRAGQGGGGCPPRSEEYRGPPERPRLVRLALWDDRGTRAVLYQGRDGRVHAMRLG